MTRDRHIAVSELEVKVKVKSRELDTFTLLRTCMSEHTCITFTLSS